MEKNKYFQRLSELNNLAESIFCHNKKLLVIDDKLNKIRETLGAYRRHEIEEYRNHLHIYDDMFLSLPRKETNMHIETIQKKLTEERAQIQNVRKMDIKKLIELNPNVTEMSLEAAEFLLKP